MLWFRWYHGTCADPKLGSIARKTGQPRERVISVWAMVLESASDAKDRGRVGVDPDGVAEVLHCDTESVATIMADIEARGMMRDGRVSAWDVRQPGRDDSLDRVRRYRQKKSESTEDVTRYTRDSNADVTRVTVLDTDKTKNREEKVSKDTLSASADAADEAGAEPAKAAGSQPAPDAGKPRGAEKAGGGKPKKARKPREDAKPEHAEVREYFCQRWQARRSADGAPYAWKYGRDDKHLRWILDQCGRDPDKAKAIVKVFIDDDDAWVAEKGHDIAMLVSRFNAYRARRTTPDEGRDADGLPRKYPTLQEVEDVLARVSGGEPAGGQNGCP